MILVTSVARMDMHRANNGQNLLGNATAIKRRNDGRVYISGRMQRHALFESIGRLNDNPDTYVSNGDATSFMIETDLRADLGGFAIMGCEVTRVAELVQFPQWMPWRWSQVTR